MLKQERVLIIGKVWPEPNSSAAGKRMMQLISFFQLKKIEVIFVSAAKTTDFQVDLKQLDIEFQQVQLNDDSFDAYVKSKAPDIVVFDRFLSEEQFGWRIDECAPNAIKILNTEDLHFLRGAREEALRKGEKIDVTKIRTDLFQRELLSIYRSDLTLLVSQFEKNLLTNHYLLPEELLYYLPVFEKKQKEIQTFEDRKDFMFIGNFYHAPNWDALKVLKSEIWPRIKKSIPEAKLHIYGAYPGQRVFDMNNVKEGFIVHGRVENAIEVTEKAKVSLVPLRFGAGIKGKLLEAMGAGTPSVTTEIGVEGMLFDNMWNGKFTNDFELFSVFAIELYQDKNKWTIAQENGFEILSKYFSESDFSLSFEMKIQDLLKNRDTFRQKNIVGSLMKHHTVQSSKYLSKWIMEKNKEHKD